MPWDGSPNCCMKPAHAGNNQIYDFIGNCKVHTQSSITGWNPINYAFHAQSYTTWLEAWTEDISCSRYLSTLARGTHFWGRGSSWPSPTGRTHWWMAQGRQRRPWWTQSASGNRKNKWHVVTLSNRSEKVVLIMRRYIPCSNGNNKF